MANICDTSIAFYTTKEYRAELDTLYGTLKPSGLLHLPSFGELLEANGIDWRNVKCRGDVTYVDDIEEYGEDGYVLFVYTSDAWGPQIDTWDALLRLPQYSHIKYVIKAEEEGCGVYINSDAEGIFFTERYFLDFVNAPDGRDHFEYFDKESDLISYMKSVTGVNFQSFEELVQYEKAGDFPWLSIGKYTNIY